MLERLGGRDAWDRTRFVHWDFFGGRRHFWDRLTGDIRIESEGDVYLLNLDSREGAARVGGEVLVEPEALAEALDRAWAMWVNDSYWMFLPYKLLDPGVVLEDLGAGVSSTGAPGRRLRLTFEAVGLTPRNAYTVFVGDESGLVEEWSFWPDAADLEAEPAFTLPWAGWERFGEIWLATDHGRGADWAIGVPETLPRELFTEL